MTVARSHVTSREAQAVCDFAVEVMTTLNMPGWQILVMEKPARKDCHASIEAIDGRYVAQLYLEQGWMKLSDQVRRDVIVHEVLHLLHVRINHVFDDARDHMHDHEHDWLRTRYWRETEYMVDHLAKFLCRTHTLEKAWDIAHGRKTN